MAGVAGFEPAPRGLEALFLRFWRPLCYRYTKPLCEILSLVWNPTTVVAAINTLIVVNSIFFSFIKFFNIAKLNHISAKTSTLLCSKIFLHLFIVMSFMFQCWEVLFSAYKNVFWLTYINFTIFKVGNFIYTRWRKWH